MSEDLKSVLAVCALVFAFFAIVFLIALYDVAAFAIFLAAGFLIMRAVWSPTEGLPKCPACGTAPKPHLHYRFEGISNAYVLYGCDCPGWGWSPSVHADSHRALVDRVKAGDVERDKHATAYLQRVGIEEALKKARGE